MRLAFLLLCAALLGGCSGTPDAEPLLDRMQDRYAADMADVRDLTVTGEGVVAYFRRTGPDSLLTFDVRVVPINAAQPPSDEASYVLDYLPNVAQWVRGLRSNTLVVGERRVGGAPAYVLETDDVRSFIGLPPGTPDEAADGGVADVAQVFVDAETARVRGLRFESRPDSTRERPLVQETFYTDYREVDGHVLPFEIRRRGEGLDQLLPDEYRIVMQGNLAIEQAQAERLPPEQRAAALADVERRRRELTTGETEASFRVDSLRVNAGVPADLFGPPGANVPAPPAEPRPAPGE